jgi:hypothetical protein
MDEEHLGIRPNTKYRLRVTALIDEIEGPPSEVCCLYEHSNMIIYANIENLHIYVVPIIVFFSRL